MIKNASISQARRPIDRQSVGKWRQVEGELAPLVEALGGARCGTRLEALCDERCPSPGVAEAIGMAWIEEDDRASGYTIEKVEAPEAGA